MQQLIIDSLELVGIMRLNGANLGQRIGRDKSIRNALAVLVALVLKNVSLLALVDQTLRK